MAVCRSHNDKINARMSLGTLSNTSFVLLCSINVRQYPPTFNKNTKKFRRIYPKAVIVTKSYEDSIHIINFVSLYSLLIALTEVLRLSPTDTLAHVE